MKIGLLHIRISIRLFIRHIAIVFHNITTEYWQMPENGISSLGMSFFGICRKGGQMSYKKKPFMKKSCRRMLRG